MTCAFTWGEGKTYRIGQTIRKADGTVAAEFTAVGGLLDLKERRLVADPACTSARWPPIRASSASETTPRRAVYASSSSGLC